MIDISTLSQRRKSLTRLIQAVVITGIMASTCAIASDDQGQYENHSPAAVRASSPAVSPQDSPRDEQGDNSVPSSQSDEIQTELDKLHLNRARLAIGNGLVLKDADKIDLGKLTEITGRLNDAVMMQVASCLMCNRLGLSTLNWIRKKDLTPEQVLNLCNLMINTEYSVDERYKAIKALTKQAFTVMPWTDWKKSVNHEAFRSPITDRTGLTAIQFESDDACENAIHETYLSLTRMVNLLGGYTAVMAEEAVTPKKQTGGCLNCGNPECRSRVLLEMLEFKKRQSSVCDKALKKESDKLYKHLLKKCFVGAKEFLAEQEAGREGITVEEFEAMLRGRGGGNVRVVHLNGDGQDVNDGEACNIM